MDRSAERRAVEAAERSPLADLQSEAVDAARRLRERAETNDRSHGVDDDRPLTEADLDRIDLLIAGIEDAVTYAGISRRARRLADDLDPDAPEREQAEQLREAARDRAGRSIEATASYGRHLEKQVDRRAARRDFRGFAGSIVTRLTRACLGQRHRRASASAPTRSRGSRRSAASRGAPRDGPDGLADSDPEPHVVAGRRGVPCGGPRRRLWGLA